MNILKHLLGAVIGAAILWLSIPLLVAVMVAAGLFFQAYGVIIVLCFPLYIILSIGLAFYEDYKKRQAAKARRPYPY